ncbi:MAG TPA: hypothetical protein VN025_17125 [Candidatus Dormibacteraeota bacterium]|nr:hypothetical protein [Candidatus Dormibacteraeota bacterium]
MRLFSAGAIAERFACLVFFLCGTLTVLGGCAERRTTHAFPWTMALMVRPNVPVAHGDTDAADLAPDFYVAPPANNGRLFGTRAAPTRPHVSVSPQPDSGNGSKTPTLVPELSAQETAAAQQQFSDSIGIVEKNLAATKGRRLSALQADTVSKVNAFLAEAREASGEGDWGRARNLAKKAQILSQDLVASF